MAREMSPVFNLDSRVMKHLWCDVDNSTHISCDSVTYGRPVDMVLNKPPQEKIKWVPPHFANFVRTFLDEEFLERWIGRGSPYITWPARSSDLTPPDFSLWGFVKDQVYGTLVRDLTD